MNAMNRSETYTDLDDYEVQQSLALGLFECFSAAGAPEEVAQ